MRSLISIALLQFRLILKNKGTILMMFGMPLLFTGLFGVLFGSGTGGAHQAPVALVDLDDSFASRQVVSVLQTEASIKVIAAAESELDQLFVDHTIDVGAIIPEGFEAAVAAGQTPEITVVKAPGGNMQVAASPIIRRAATLVAQSYGLAQRLDPTNPQAAYNNVMAERQSVQVGVTETRETPHANSTGTQVQSSALGFTVMFVMMMLVTLGGTILQERSVGTWARLLTTPAGRASVMGGYLLAFFLIGVFQLAVLVGVSSLLFGVDWGPLPQLAAVSAAMVVCAAGLGLFLSAWLRSAEQQRAIGSAVVMITSFLGGVFWPLDLMGKSMQWIGRLTPQAWAMDGLREVMLRGGSWAHLTLPLAVLGTLTVLFMGVGLMRARFE